MYLFTKDVYISKVVVPCNFCTLHFLIWVPLHVPTMPPRCPPQTLLVYLTPFKRWATLRLASPFALKITWMITSPLRPWPLTSPATPTHERTWRWRVHPELHKAASSNHRFQSKANQSSRFRQRSLFSEWYVYLIKCSASLFSVTLYTTASAAGRFKSHVIYFMLL